MAGSQIATISATKFLFCSYCLLPLFLLCSSFHQGGEALKNSHYHTLQLSSLLPPTSCNLSTKAGHKNGRSSSLKVVHRHGPCSKLGEKKPTLIQTLSQDESRVKLIQSRVAYNSGRSSSALLEDVKTAATLPAKRGGSLGTGNYIVTVGLGTPRRYLSLVFDTGSDLTWTQCQPCVSFCYNQRDPKFDPSESKTYRNVSCRSPQCSALESATGNYPACTASASTCVYGISYGDQSFSIGYFGAETLSLTPSDVFPNFLFGCGQDNQGLFGATAGLIGLGRDRLSLISQTASKYGKYFSYCLPTQSSTGHLTFGGGGRAPRAAKYTPLLTRSQDPSFYFIDIAGIRVGGTLLSISSSVFKSAGTVIDSGTVITRLPPAAYSALRAEFRRQMSMYPMADPESILDTCYDLSRYSTVAVPKVSFIFGGNVEVALNPRGVLYGGSPSKVCLAFAGNSDQTTLGIFGNVQQRTLEVIYDVAGGKLGFASGGCS